MVEVIGSKIDSYSLKDSFVQGEQGSDAITFKLNAALTGYTWRVRGTVNGSSTESADITPTESASSVQVAWTPTGAFMAQAGMLYLTLVGKKSNGTIINKAIGSVEILPDMAMQSAGTITQSLFEQLIAQCSASAQDSEAWAVGKRSGVDVPSTDPTYHNNAKYYASQAGDYANLSNKPSINSVTLLGNKTSAELGVISDPEQKSSGQYLKYDGTSWIAAAGGGGGGAVESVNGMTGAVTLNYSHVGAIANPSSKSANQYLKYNGSNWVASTLSKVSLVKIWENASPGSTFESQQITVNTSAYDCVLIEIRRATDAAMYLSFPILSKEIGYNLNVMNANAKTYWNRGATVYDSYITFTNCYKCVGTTNSSDNNGVIPVAVYGLANVSVN